MQLQAFILILTIILALVSLGETIPYPRHGYRHGHRRGHGHHGGHSPRGGFGRGGGFGGRVRPGSGYGQRGGFGRGGFGGGFGRFPG
ncbi:unnamed protein product [Strongylus vulgaris]|uniref:Uncharacterized protein n=1 Tax=Strongylus vulgaris TaxID=40348 RepID=A0A3P7IPF9_STRVU|nr:unnamed protein product [Strongylus vulgaris]